MKNIQMLFVDDEELTVNALKRFLHKSQYALYFAQSADEGLTIMASTPIHIIVTDMKMPVMDGLSLLRVVKKKYPDTVRLALSAITLPSQLLPCINTGEIFRYITKPIDPEELRTVLQEAVDYYLSRKDRIEFIAELREKNEMLRQALIRQEQPVGELKASMVREKQLMGLLPICSFCKKIRDEKDNWEQIEVYIRDHSEAELSHGICPECLKKHYPDFA
jgi:phosphoserine phosphatase RsbU/P